MRKKAVILCLLFAVQTQAQVIDVNGDGTVGPHEAIAVAEEWKQEAKAADAHDHLGQTWTGEGNPLKLEGSFSERLLPFPSQSDAEAALPFRSPSAPLVLKNTSPSGYGLKIESEGQGISIASEGPALILRGSSAVVAATAEAMENLSLLSNNNFYIYLDHNRDEPHTSGLYIFGRSGYSILELNEDGDMWLKGTLTQANLKTQVDHPLDPANKDLDHSAVASPEMKTVCDGIAVLDDRGEASVELPDCLQAPNTEFRYQLTCIGGFAPVYIAEKVNDNRFKIGGGTPGLEVSWMVTGVR